MTDYPHPNVRRLRIFSFDPALAASYDLAGVSGITIEIPWENDLEPGPVGEYIEVVDVDPASGAVYAPVDLNDPHLLAQRRPGAVGVRIRRFHQQMVYAVAMTTIEHFERALGRKALWSSHRRTDSDGKRITRSSCRGCASIRTRCASSNAYYSPQKKALLFGYFPVTAKDGEQHAGHDRLHLPVARHHRARDHARAARRRASALQRAGQSRMCSPSTRRSPTSSRCSSTSPIRACCATRSRAPAAISHSESLLGQLAQQFGAGDRPRRRAARRISASKTRDRQVGAAQARSDTCSSRPPSRTTAAPSWWPPSSAPS